MKVLLVLCVIATFLYTSEARVTFCDKYASALSVNDSYLVGQVVSKTVAAALASGDTELKQFFDGKTPAGSTDFTTNTGAFNTLFAHLVEFFGSALGCSDGTIGTYQGNTDLKAVHAQMPITLAFFNAFNNAVISSCQSLGVTDQTDLNGVLTVLQSTMSLICNQPDCTASTGTPATTAAAASTTAAAGDSSSLAPMVALIVGLVAMLL